MEKTMEQKVREVNTILKYMRLPIDFRFACFNLKSYEPSMTLKDMNFETRSLSCEVDENKEVKFFFRHYPSLKPATNFKEYEENKQTMKRLDAGISMLNSLHLKVPEYVED